MNQWYSFAAHNTTAQYGYGSASEADRYADYLNRDRDINCFHAVPLTDEDAVELRLGENTEAVNLDDELAAIAGIR
jgi:hypothetical protein